MVHNPNLEKDEARRDAQHADVKAVLAGEVNRAIESEGRRAVAHEHAEVATVGRELEHRAVREVAERESDVARTRRSARLAQVIDYVFYVIYGIIVVSIVLEAVGASDANGFKGVMDTLSWPFLEPFRGLVADPSIGRYRFMFSFLAALVVWVLIHLAIRGLLRVIGHRKTTL